MWVIIELWCQFLTETERTWAHTLSFIQYLTLCHSYGDAPLSNFYLLMDSVLVMEVKRCRAASSASSFLRTSLSASNHPWAAAAGSSSSNRAKWAQMCFYQNTDVPMLGWNKWSHSITVAQAGLYVRKWPHYPIWQFLSICPAEVAPIFYFVDLSLWTSKSLIKLHSSQIVKIIYM